MKKSTLLIVLIAAVCVILACILFLFPMLGGDKDAEGTDLTEKAGQADGAVPFTAESDGTALTDISVSTLDSFVQDGMVTTSNVTLYTVSVPAGAESVDFTFSEADGVIPYNYSPEGTWLAGSYEDCTKGFSEMSCSLDADGDGVTDYIAVQTPYDADWHSDLLYLVTFAD